MNTPEINELLNKVEEHYGQKLHTSTDFDEFSLMLKRRGFGHVSASTLKRLWAYVNDTHTPRVSTLDILASYIGYSSFDAFTEWLKTSSSYNSSFFSASHLSSGTDIHIGADLAIGWLPNRIVRLKYLGNSEYEVTRSENSKLMKGDRFMTGCFIKGQPLFLPYIIRNGEKTPSFIAGRNGGISYLKVIDTDGEH